MLVILGDRLGNGELALGLGTGMVMRRRAEWRGHKSPKPQLNGPAAFPALLDEKRNSEQVEPVRARTIPNWLAMAACLLLAVALGYVMATSLVGAPAYATGIGERRLIVLHDGTKVELNTDSRIVVHYAKGRREVELARGEAMLHIMAGRQPFVLRTKEGRLRTNRSAEVGVRMLGSTTKVTVKRGSVESLGSDSSIPRLLGPNSEAIVRNDGIQVLPIATEAADRQLAWREGAIALDGQTIYEAVSEINRYNTRQIIVKDQITGAIRVGGYFQTLDVDEFAAALAKAFALEVVRQADGNLALVAARSASSRAPR